MLDPVFLHLEMGPAQDVPRFVNVPLSRGGKLVGTVRTLNLAAPDLLLGAQVHAARALLGTLDLMDPVKVYSEKAKARQPSIFKPSSYISLWSSHSSSSNGSCEKASKDPTTTTTTTTNRSC